MNSFCFWCAIAILWLGALPLSAQIDFTRYFDESALPIVDTRDHLDATFKWNMPGNIQIHLNEGINYLKEENQDLAVANLSEVLKLDSTSWVSYYYRGICHKNLGDLVSAREDFLQSLHFNDEHAATYVELGELFQINGLLSKAIELYQKAITLDPKLVEAYYGLGCVTLVKGDYRRGLKYFEQCNEVDPKFPQAYMMQGILKFRDRKKDNQSIALFNKATEADSSYALTYLWRGLALIALDKPVEALKDWSTLVRLDPGNHVYVLLRGCLYIEMGDFDNAFNDLRKTIRAKAVDDDRFTAQQSILDKQIDLQYAANYLITNGYGLNEEAFGFLKKGFCLILSGRYKPAIEELKKAEKVEVSATVYFIHALALEHFGDHYSALNYYNKALALDDDIFDAHKKRGVYRAELKQWKGAYEDFEDMLRLQPNTPVAYRIRGLVRSSEGDFKGAIADLNKFMKVDSTDYEVIRTRSVCYAKVGDEHAANEDLRKLMKLESGWELYETVAGNYLILRDTISAIEVWREFAAEKPGIFIPYAELAKIFVSQKKWDSASINIEKAMPMIVREAMPKKHSELLCLKGLIDFENARYREAIVEFSFALKIDGDNQEAKYHRALAHEKVGETKKAMADFKALKNANYRDAQRHFEALSSQ